MNTVRLFIQNVLLFSFIAIVLGAGIFLTDGFDKDKGIGNRLAVLYIFYTIAVFFFSIAVIYIGNENKI